MSGGGGGSVGPTEGGGLRAGHGMAGPTRLLLILIIGVCQRSILTPLSAGTQHEAICLLRWT